jgi:hypothetical protein
MCQQPLASFSPLPRHTPIPGHRLCDLAEYKCRIFFKRLRLLYSISHSYWHQSRTSQQYQQGSPKEDNPTLLACAVLSACPLQHFKLQESKVVGSPSHGASRAGQSGPRSGPCSVWCTRGATRPCAWHRPTTTVHKSGAFKSTVSPATRKVCWGVIKWGRDAVPVPLLRLALPKGRDVVRKRHLCPASNRT